MNTYSKTNDEQNLPPFGYSRKQQSRLLVIGTKSDPIFLVEDKKKKSLRLVPGTVKEDVQSGGTVVGGEGTGVEYGVGFFTFFLPFFPYFPLSFSLSLPSSLFPSLGISLPESWNHPSLSKLEKVDPIYLDDIIGVKKLRVKKYQMVFS